MENHARIGIRLGYIGISRPAGMTLIELLVTIGITAVMLSIAVPSFDALLTNNRLASIANTYLTSLHLARSEATKRNSRVALCKSADGASCTTNSHWDQGWLLFHDINNNAQVDTDETVIRTFESLPSNYILRGNAPVANYVSFASTGGARMVSGAFQAGTLTLCKTSTEAADARSIVISATGRPRVQTTIASTCP